MARAPVKRKRKAAKNRGTGRFFLLLVLGAVLSIATPATVILAIGLMPTFVAYLVDREPEGYASVAVGGLNFAALIPFLLTFWSGPHTLNSALAIIVNVETLVVVYAAAGAGWVIYFAMPTVAFVYLKFSIDSRVQRMQREQAQLLKEWGEGLKEEVVEADKAAPIPTAASRRRRSTPPPRRRPPVRPRPAAARSRGS